MVETAPPDVFEAIIRAQQGDQKALERVVESNLGLVRHVVGKWESRGGDWEDLFQVGCIGLCKAVQRFDPAFGVQFSTYAVPLILGEIKQFLRDDGPIKVSRTLKTLAYQVQQLRETYREKTGEEPTIGMLAEELEVDPAEITLSMEAMEPIQSLYRRAENGEEYCLLDCLGEQDESEQMVDRLCLSQILGQLTVRERQIMVMRYYQQKTQAEIATVLHISQVQVSRLEKKILQNMRQML